MNSSAQMSSNCDPNIRLQDTWISISDFVSTDIKGWISRFVAMYASQSIDFAFSILKNSKEEEKKKEKKNTEVYIYKNW